MEIQKLELFTGQLAQMLVFYRDVLQCRVDGDEHGFTIKTAHSIVHFLPASTGNPQYHFAFTIPPNQVAEAEAWTSERVPLIPIPGGGVVADFRNWNAAAFYFTDPAGNIVEFIARQSVGQDATAPFSGSSLLSVSEIGLVTEDVERVCSQLQEEWGVPIFSKQPPTPHFAAMGNDKGLFIVVSEQRHWYPTNQPASKAAFAATFMGEAGHRRTFSVH